MFPSRHDCGATVYRLTDHYDRPTVIDVDTHRLGMWIVDGERCRPATAAEIAGGAGHQRHTCDPAEQAGLFEVGGAT